VPAARFGLTKAFGPRNNKRTAAKSIVFWCLGECRCARNRNAVPEPAGDSEKESVRAKAPWLRRPLVTGSTSRRIFSIEEYESELNCNHSQMAREKSAISLNARFGKRLAGLRKEKRWTYTYLSEHSGLAVGFLHAIEHGEKEPCLNTLDILAKSFELSIAELMRGI
jgi:hypothetical protein